MHREENVPLRVVWEEQRNNNERFLHTVIYCVIDDPKEKHKKKCCQFKCVSTQNCQTPADLDMIQAFFQKERTHWSLVSQTNDSLCFQDDGTVVSTQRCLHRQRGREQFWGFMAWSCSVWKQSQGNPVAFAEVRAMGLWLMGNIHFRIDHLKDY